MIWSVLLIILLIILSAMFSGSEIAFSSSKEIKLRKCRDSGKRSGRLAYEIFEKFEEALVSILIGNNLVNIASSSVATVIATGLMGDGGAWIASAVMTVLIIIFGEITPKIIASGNPEKTALMVSLPIRCFMWITLPFVILQGFLNKHISKLWDSNKNEDAVTVDDLETMLETAEDEGVVDEDTADLLQNALDFDEVCAYEIITPRVDMFALDIDSDERLIKNEIINSRHSRIPIYDGSTDNIVGVVHMNYALKEMAAGRDFDLRHLMMKPVFVHKTMPIPEVLEIMQRSKQHLVIVTDEYGGTMGIITMEDVLEQLVGEIWDEKDVIDEEFVQMEDGSFEADASMRIEDLFDELDVDERDFDDDNATVGGWVIEMLEGYPKKGDSFSYKNLDITVSEVRNLRVMSVNIVQNHILLENSSDEE